MVGPLFQCEDNVANDSKEVCVYVSFGYQWDSEQYATGEYNLRSIGPLGGFSGGEDTRSQRDERQVGQLNG